MDVADLRVFAKVAELRSVSAAARALGMPKSTVSRNLARLEQAVGSALIKRTTRQWQLTDAGVLLHEHARRILGAIEEAEAELSHARGTPRGLLRVNAPFTFGHALLAPLLPEFLRRYPEVRVALDLSNRRIDAAREDVDVIIRVGALGDSELTARKLGVVELVLCASPDYLSARGTPAHPAELAQHEVVDRQGAHDTIEWQLTSGAGAGAQRAVVQLAPRLAVGDPSTILTAVLAGIGLGWVPPFLCTEPMREARLVRVLPDWHRPPQVIHALYHGQRSASPKLRVFIDYLATALAPLRG